jgi:putative protease
LKEGIDEAHARGKQFFVVSNIFPHNAKLTTYLADMAPVIALKPDALIMSDPGLIDMVRETWPEQASTFRCSPIPSTGRPCASGRS